MGKGRIIRGAAALCLLFSPAGVYAQEVPEASTAVSETPLADEPAPAPIAQDSGLPDPETIPTPDLAFELTQSDIDNFDKYFYFNREDTSFAEAYADIVECDSLASGISYYAGGSEPYLGYYGSQYGIGGAIGGVIGSALADAIYGSAARRKIRRINMRNCMGFKGYSRYGLAKTLWESFNFEEGNGRKRDDVREAALLQQAKVASGPRPHGEELGI